MRILIKSIVFMIVFGVSANAQHDTKITELIQKYTDNMIQKCEIFVQADVEGMNIPNKTIQVEYGEDNKPKVTGKGLSLLPKKGMVNQFKSLLSEPFQAIYLSKRGQNLVYKLVALDTNSDWITADLVFDENTFQIYQSTITTQKHGAFTTKNTFGENFFPSQSVITFSVKKFKIPLKFIGRTLKASDQPDSDKEVIGKIILNYTYQ